MFHLGNQIKRQMSFWGTSLAVVGILVIIVQVLNGPFLVRDSISPKPTLDERSLFEKVKDKTLSIVKQDEAAVQQKRIENEKSFSINPFVLNKGIAIMVFTLGGLSILLRLVGTFKGESDAMTHSAISLGLIVIETEIYIYLAHLFILSLIVLLGIIIVLAFIKGGGFDFS